MNLMIRVFLLRKAMNRKIKCLVMTLFSDIKTKIVFHHQKSLTSQTHVFLTQRLQALFKNMTINNVSKVNFYLKIKLLG